jgi:hypothetical protein
VCRGSWALESAGMKAVRWVVWKAAEKAVVWTGRWVTRLDFWKAEWSV